MKKISLITIALLIFVFAISCVSAADQNVDMTNNTPIDNTIDIADVQNVDFNISSQDNSSLNIEPLENDTNTPSELNITGPKPHSGELNIPGPKIQINENSNTKTDSLSGRNIAETITGYLGGFTGNPILLGASVVMIICDIFDWW